MTFVGWVVYFATSHGGIDAGGKPIGTDFIGFWAASRFALEGHPSWTYDPALQEAAIKALRPHADPGYPFFYPPTFLLLCLPLALLPYYAALAAWLGASFLLLYTGLIRLLPQRWAILPILAFPGSLINLGHGQNGFLTAACLVWSVVLSPARPFLAGMCLGVLVIKPHLILAAPVALLAGGRWRMIAGGIASGLGLCGLSWAVLGTASWRAFLTASPIARAVLEQGQVEYGKYQSLFAGIRLLHGGVVLAYSLQGLLAACVCLVLIRVCRVAAARPAGVAFCAGTLLCTPYLLDYDLVCLAPVIAWVAAEAQLSGWRPWEKTALLAAYLLPLVARPLALDLGVPVAPLVMIALLAVVARRVVHASAPAIRS
jgi:hypothetical protein